MSKTLIIGCLIGSMLMFSCAKPSRVSESHPDQMEFVVDSAYRSSAGAQDLIIIDCHLKQSGPDFIFNYLPLQISAVFYDANRARLGDPINADPLVMPSQDFLHGRTNYYHVQAAAKDPTGNARYIRLGIGSLHTFIAPIQQ